MSMYRRSIIGVLLALVIFSCKKDELEVVPDNTAPPYDGIPTVVVQNYVNRLFIDLIGREPLDVEMDAEVATLESNSLSLNSRKDLVNKLMTNTDFIQGDSSYNHAYYRRLYELSKSRTLEAASDAQIDFYIGLEQQAATADSLGGDSAGLAEHRFEIEKMNMVKSSWREYKDSLIECDEMLRRMCYNRVYDQINMNSFNYINATFDDLYQRFPTQSEFDNAYDMVEYNVPNIIFGQAGTTKRDYIDIMISVQEFYEGMIRWSYNTYLARDPSTYEVFTAMNTFWSDHDLQKVQRDILITDEYANFD